MSETRELPAQAQASELLAADSHAHALCGNCDAPLTGPYCAQCGQSSHVHRSLLHLAEEILHGVLHFDAKGWKTLPLLVFAPGRLTRSYIDGRRQKFVSPLALFLFLLFLTFFVASFAGRNAGGETPAAAQAASHAQAGAGHNQPASLAVRMATQLKTKGWIHSDLPQVEAATRLALDNPDLAVYKLKNTAYKFSFLLIPISLPFLWLMFFWKRGVAMFDHAVFVLYSLCFMSLLFMFLVLLEVIGWTAPIPWLVALAPPLHMWAQLRGAYGIGGVAALWRTLVLLFVASFSLLVFLLTVLVLSMR